MSIGEKAIAIHAQGFNCAQSVIAALAEHIGIDDLTAKQVSAGFGGGLRTGEACGALTGAIMALGFGVAKDGIGSKSAPIAEHTKRMVAEFTEKYNAVRCDDLMDLTGGSHERCDDYISYCAQLAAAIIEENENNKQQ